MKIQPIFLGAILIATYQHIHATNLLAKTSMPSQTIQKKTTIQDSVCDQQNTTLLPSHRQGFLLRQSYGGHNGGQAFEQDGGPFYVKTTQGRHVEGLTLLRQGYEGLTPENAIKTAFKNRSILKIRTHEIEQAWNQSLVALSGLLPQIGVNTTLSKIKPGQLGPHSTNVGFSQLIWSFNGPLQDYFILRKTTDIAHAQKLLSYDNTRFNVENTLLNLFNTTIQRASIAALDRATHTRFAKAEVQNNVGFFSANQWEEEKALYAQDMANVLSYTDQYLRDENIFERSIAEQLTQQLDPLTTELFIRASIEKADQFPLDHWLERAHIHRKELLIKDEEIEQAEYIKHKSLGSYLPSASLFVNLNKLPSFVPSTCCNQNNCCDRVSPFEWRAGISFNWNFDGFGSAHQVSADEALILARIMEKRDISNNITIEVQTAYHDLQQLLKQLEAQKERTQQREIAFKQATIQLEVGIISPVEFENVQQDWEQSAFDLETVQIETARKYRDLLFKSGYPDDY